MKLVFSISVVFAITHPETVPSEVAKAADPLTPINRTSEVVGHIVDSSKEDRGIFSISSVNPKCCQQAKDLWHKHGREVDEISTPVFLSPCTGVTVSGVSSKVMKVLKWLVEVPHIN
ncbi:hypothetical protein VPNG_08959 [Cytospora leucostoma]|uniref:Uncharacterized protein n=1 Tax=Cytospora leucostoma TaxID=1230097 RepID=A0A423VW49_9PEZI|nr:hypothetical protein VPNG_08959 [Cytospora leucostoma]